MSSKFEKDSLGTRIKSYEKLSSNVLDNDNPVIIRVDGKAFHTYTKNCIRPFDKSLNDVMIITAIELCKNVQGCKLAYVQSDEISLLLCSHLNKISQPWFDNKIQKMCSISAAISSVTFTINSDKIENHIAIKPALFDSRVFGLPSDEVCNYFIWRQQDNIRNSVQMFARSLYSQKQLHGLNCDQLKQKCIQKEQNWENIDTRFKYGVCIVKQYFPYMDTIRSLWVPDFNIPLFKSDRNYIDNHLISPT